MKKFPIRQFVDYFSGVQGAYKIHLALSPHCSLSQIFFLCLKEPCKVLFSLIIKRCKHKVASDAPPGPLFPPAHPRVFLFMRVFLMRRLRRRLRRRRRRRLFPLTLIALDFDEIFFDCDDVCNPLFPLTAFFFTRSSSSFFSSGNHLCRLSAAIDTAAFVAAFATSFLTTSTPFSPIFHQFRHRLPPRSSTPCPNFTTASLMQLV